MKLKSGTKKLLESVLLQGGLLSLCLASTANAQEEADDNVYVLNPFFVIGESEPGDLILKTKDIEKLQPLDLNDLFANESTMAVGGGAAVAQKIYVRGFEDTMLNVTVDGAQQSAELYHHQGRVQLEPEFIKTIQLDAGAGAATNGAGALTGALKVTTKDAFDMLRDGQNYGSFVKAAYGINGEDNYKGVFSAYGKVNENIGVIATYTYQDGDDYEDGNGNLVTPTGYTHERGYVKVNGKWGAHENSLTFEKMHDYGVYYERPNMIGFNARFQLSENELNRETVTYNHRYNPESDLVDTSFTAYWTKNDFDIFEIEAENTYGSGYVKSYGFDLRNSSILGKHGMTYGVEYRNDESDSMQHASSEAFWNTSQQEASVLGLYFQDSWHITEAVNLSAGLRYDSYDHKVTGGVGEGAKNDVDGLSPNIGVNWNVTKDLTLFATYSTAYRGVTIREAFFSALYEHRGDLEAEEADNIEVGFSYKKNGYFVSGTVYKQEIDNYISSVYVGSDSVWGYWGNVGTAEVTGYELELGREWDNWYTSFGVWDAENELNDSDINDADLGLGTNIGRTWTNKVNYSWTKYDVNFGLTNRYVEKQENSISELAGYKPCYFVSDFHVTWNPDGTDRWTLSLKVNNILDRFYYDHATYSWNARGPEETNGYIGFQAKGREIILSTSYKY